MTAATSEWDAAMAFRDKMKGHPKETEFVVAVVQIVTARTGSWHHEGVHGLLMHLQPSDIGDAFQRVTAAG